MPQGKCVLLVLLASRRNGSLLQGCALFFSGLLVLDVVVKGLGTFLHLWRDDKHDTWRTKVCGKC